jgi:hypothetical protein
MDHHSKRELKAAARSLKAGDLSGSEYLSTVLAIGEREAVRAEARRQAYRETRDARAREADPDCDPDWPPVGSGV